MKANIPIYQPIIDRLRCSIQTGKIAPGQKIGSEYQLVREAGISRLSVRRAIDFLVEEGLVERHVGRGLYACQPRPVRRHIQVLTVQINDFCSRILKGIKSIANSRGFLVQISDAGGNMESEIAALRDLPHSSVDGAIIMALYHPGFTKVFCELALSNYPFVLVDQRLTDLLAASVLADNHEGGRRVGQELLALGHRRIAFIGDLAIPTVQDRLNGLRDVVNGAGMLLDSSLIPDLRGMQTGIKDPKSQVISCTRKLMDGDRRPSAIFYAGDGIAAIGCHVLKQLGIRIPQDISVVGFDDLPLCEWLEPPLATIRQPLEEMGATALEMLIEMIGNRNAVPRQVVLPVTWIPRGSIGKIS